MQLLKLRDFITYVNFIEETSSVDSEKLWSSAGSVDIAEESKVIHNSLKSKLIHKTTIKTTVDIINRQISLNIYHLLSIINILDFNIW